MEWADDMHSKLVVHPRAEHITTTAASGKPGLSWTSKHGFVTANSYGLDVTVDGINEHGLSYGALWLPGSVYQDIKAGDEASALPILSLGTWVLGNFQSVDEAVKAIQSVKVWGPLQQEIAMVPTLHVALHDANGRSAVIEFVNGEQKIYDNPNGVLTNAPTFDWHRTNLSNYIHLDATNPRPIEIAGTVLSPPGQGGGFLGIPGDWTPPSRFVRTTAMLAFAHGVPDADSAVNLAEHILNAVDIPRGAVRGNVEGKTHTDYTQWVLIKDLKGKRIFFRGYDDTTIRFVDLQKLDFSAGSSHKQIPIDNEDRKQSKDQVEM